MSTKEHDRQATQKNGARVDMIIGATGRRRTRRRRSFQSLETGGAAISNDWRFAGAARGAFSVATAGAMADAAMAASCGPREFGKEPA